MKFCDAFISYGRADSKPFATQLNEKMTAAGLNIWFDQEDIPLAVDFQEQINDGIEKSHNFLFVIAPHSVNSPYCLKEIELAIKLNKRIIPLLHVEQISQETWRQRNPDKTEDDWQKYQEKGLHSSYPNMHPTISKINWVYFRDNLDDFSASFTGLLAAINQHQDYVEQHTKILLQALKWSRNQKQTNYLLVGAERVKAEQWLKQRFIDEQQPCIPTDLHCEYICESIKNSNNLLTQVFLSYSDKQDAIKEKIRKTLMRESLTVWTNKTDIKTGSAFQEAINQGIEGADNFIYLISLDALKSEYCQQELNHALTYNKRIIPLLIEDIDLGLIPTQLRKIQFIDFTKSESEEEYNFSADKLLQELTKEPSYYEEHKILLVKVIKWQKQNRNSTLLLRGYNLQHFESWLMLAKQREDYLPLPIQEEFITASLNKPEELSLEVFISYSRANSDFARKLNDALQELGKTTWFDQESIATGSDFQQEIYRGIANSNNFLFIISPNSVNSPYCADEVEYAHKLNKRFITILHLPLSDNDQQKLPSALASVQWLDFNQHGGQFYPNFNELIRTLNTDREHVRNHTKWSQRALEWQEKDKSVDLLLRGSEFSTAEEWLKRAEIEKKNPPATDIQREFITQSQEAIKALEKQDKQKLLVLRSWGGTLILLVLSLGLAVFALSEKNSADKARKNADITTNIYKVQNLVTANLELDALVASLKLGKELKKLGEKNIEANTKALVVSIIGQVFYEIKEINRLEGHSDAVNSVAFSPDGKTIASASADKTVKLWNLQGHLSHTFKGHSGAVNSVAFSPDGKTIASASADKTVKLWNLQGHLSHTFKGHSGAVNSVAFSPDGKTIASASADKTVKLWNLQGKNSYTFKGHSGAVNSVAFSPDGKTIASASADKTVKLWNLQGKNSYTFKGHSSDEHGVVNSVAFSPDGKTIASASQDTTVKLWNLQGKISRNFPGHADGVKSVVFSKDGKTIVSASAKIANLWNLQGELLDTFEGHGNYVNSVAFSPDNKIIASASKDKTIKLWNLQGQSLHTFTGHSNYVHSVAFSPDGKTIASASDDKTVKLWNLQGKISRNFTDRKGTVYDVAFSPNGKTIASASGDTTVKLWNLQGKILHTFTGHSGAVNSVAFSPDGKTIASASDDNTVKLWNLQGKILHTFTGHSGAVNSVAFSPDGKTIASASNDNTVKLWNLQGKILHTFTGHSGAVNSVAFSPDGKTIASASNDNTVKLWNLQGKISRNFTGHNAPVNSVAFSPDGKTIVSASNDNTVNLWNLQGQLLQTFKGHNDYVLSVAFSPDGKTIVSASQDKTVKLWNILDVDQLLTKECDWISDYLHNNPSMQNSSDRDLCNNVNGNR